MEMFDMIKVQVRLYAPFSNYIDRKKIEVEIEENATFTELLLKVAEVYPNFRSAIPDVTDRCIFYNNMVPVLNCSVVGLQQNLKDGDEISLFGSISGG
jgi:molybdopterin converting factor small subunit